MKKKVSKIQWSAGLGYRNPHNLEEIKSTGERHKGQDYAEKPLEMTAKHASGIERLYKLAGHLLENSGL